MRLVRDSARSELLATPFEFLEAVSGCTLGDLIWPGT
jgi:hypothetical protein